MIYFNINIRNPWSTRFENVKNWSDQISEHKWWEIEILKTENLFRFTFQFTVMQDHAGIEFQLGLLGWEFHSSIYDNRHWDYESKCWHNYS